MPLSVVRGIRHQVKGRVGKKKGCGVRVSGPRLCSHGKEFQML